VIENKEDLLSDYVTAGVVILEIPGINDRLRRGVFHKLIEIYSSHRDNTWVSKEFFWSEIALKHCKDCNGDKRNLKALLHEHPVPTKYALDALMSRAGKSDPHNRTFVQEILTKASVVCIVHNEKENKRLYKYKMSGNWDFKNGDIWYRYHNPKSGPAIAVASERPQWDAKGALVGFEPARESGF